jgi:hypothetical protein
MLTCKGWAFVYVAITCQPAGAPPDTYCSIAKPIYWSGTDSRVTKEQVDRHNRVWKKLCGAR